jgi:hypothetical protein
MEAYINTEEIVERIAKMVELLPSDIDTRKEICSVMNDALAHNVVETDNTPYFSMFLTKQYLDYIEFIYDNLPGEITERVSYDDILEIVTNFKEFMDNKLQEIILENVKNLLIAGFNIESLKESTETED